MADSRDPLGAFAFTQKTVKAPIVQPIEPLKGYWIGNRMWGDQYQGPLPSAAGTTIGVTELPNTPGPPRVYSFQLFRNDDPNPAVQANADVRAVITYGVGAKQNSFLCDWLHGVQVSLLASYCRVDALTYAPLDPTSTGYGYGVVGDSQIILGAALGAGTPANPIPLTYTEPAFDSVGAGSSNIFAVPDFARQVIVRGTPYTGGGSNFQDPAVASNILILFAAGSGRNIWIADASLSAGGNGSQGIVLPGGTRFIQILNNNGGPTGSRRISVTWLLGL